VALAVAIAAGPAAAQELSADDRRARTHFEAGRLHYEDGAYDRALEEFQRAWELSHRAPLLINLATVKERLAMYREAAADLRQYLELVPDAPERARLERRIANLERLERERGQPSQAEAQARAEAAPAPAEAAAATPQTPQTAATPQTAQTAAPSPAEPASGPDGGLLAGALAGYGVALAGGVLMGVFGGLALSEDAALADGCGATASCTDEQVADANTFALVSDVGLGLAAAGAAAGTVLLILGLSSSGADEDRASVAPWLAPEGAGVVTRGRF
jgi:tetratricopeptide (TPR) repeat protein